jgi:hypothetical protein
VVIKAVCAFLAHADRGIRDLVLSIGTESHFRGWLLPFCFQPLRSKAIAVNFCPVRP